MAAGTLNVDARTLAVRTRAPDRRIRSRGALRHEPPSRSRQAFGPREAQPQGVEPQATRPQSAEPKAAGPQGAQSQGQSRRSPGRGKRSRKASRQAAGPQDTQPQGVQPRNVEPWEAHPQGAEPQGVGPRELRSRGAPRHEPPSRSREAGRPREASGRGMRIQNQPQGPVP